jgi:hypothetical protein
MGALGLRNRRGDHGVVRAAKEGERKITGKAEGWRGEREQLVIIEVNREGLVFSVF